MEAISTTTYTFTAAIKHAWVCIVISAVIDEVLPFPWRVVYVQGGH